MSAWDEAMRRAMKVRAEHFERRAKASEQRAKARAPYQLCEDPDCPIGRAHDAHGPAAGRQGT